MKERNDAAPRREPWEYDRELYKERNIVERLFSRLKRFRHLATRYDKLDALFLGFIHLALIFDNLSRVARTRSSGRGVAASGVVGGLRPGRRRSR